jgi:hypothetical protein
MEKRCQVFASSAFHDLEEERQEVISQRLGTTAMTRG